FQRLPQLTRAVFELNAGAGVTDLAESEAAAFGSSKRESRLPRIQELEVLGRIGQGSSGVVYEAYDLRLRRRVAVKLVWRENLSPELRARVRVEAEAVARLNHPHVVQIFSFGETDERPYVVLEFVGGGTLAERLQGRPLPPCDAAAIAGKLARAVAYAHDRQVVHRDLNPSNVLLEGDKATPIAAASPKITDFGLAKILDSEQKWTRTGQFLGTPAYAAPEQLSGAPTDVGTSADIYAIGAILYEMLTGRPPHQADDVWHTMRLVLDADPVSPRRLQPGVPPDLETICLKCLHKSPARRYATANDLADDLDRFLAGRPIVARPIGLPERVRRWSARNRRFAATLAALFTVMLASVAGTVWAALHFRRLGQIERGLSTANENLATRNWAARMEAEQRLFELRRHLAIQALQQGDAVETLANSVAILESRMQKPSQAIPGLESLGPTSDADAAELAAREDVENVALRLRAANAVAHLPRPVLRYIVPDQFVESGADADHQWSRVRFTDMGRRIVLSDDWTSRALEVDSDGLNRWIEPRPGALICDDFEWQLVFERAGDPSSQMRLAPLGREGESFDLALPEKIEGRWRQAWRSPQGHAFAAMCEAGDRGAVYLWKLPEGRLVTPTPLYVELRPARTQFTNELFLVSTPKETRVCEVATGNIRFTRSFASPSPAALNRSGTYGAVGGVQRLDFLAFVTPQLDVSDIASGEDLVRAAAVSLDFSSVEPAFAVGGADGRLAVLSVGPKVQRRFLWQMASGGVSHVRFRPQGDLLAAATQSGTLIVRSAVTGEIVVPELPHRRAIADLQWSHDGRRVAVLTRDHLLTVWDLSELGPRFELPSKPGDPQLAFVLSSDSTKLFASQGRELTVWDTQTRQTVARLDIPAPFLMFAYDTLPSGLVALIGSSKPSFNRGRVAVFDWQTKQVRLSADFDLSPMPRAPVVSPDGRRILVPHLKGWRLIDASDFSVETEVKTRRGETIRHAFFSPDGKQIALAGAEGRASLWDLETREETHVWRPAEGDQDHLLLFDPSGRYLLSWGQFGFFAWDRVSGRQLLRSTADEIGLVTGIAFSQDGRLFATVAQQRVVQVWTSHGWRRVGKPMTGSGTILDTRFAADDQAFAMIYAGQGCDLWDWRRGERLGLPFSQRLVHSYATLSRDGRRAFFANTDGAIRAWDWATKTLDDMELIRLARQLTHTRVVGEEDPASAQELVMEWRTTIAKPMDDLAR
ncbi:MAG TPA: WD40 repeat domain-containing serine/threonine protein kinase, partial [Pirellulaceae bacterium]|nr:WD40 repeat domain-containing serine/threonine protein kinase [Pirellulaceae bacterium]